MHGAGGKPLQDLGRQAVGGAGRGERDVMRADIDGNPAVGHSGGNASEHDVAETEPAIGDPALEAVGMADEVEDEGRGGIRIDLVGWPTC